MREKRTTNWKVAEVQVSYTPTKNRVKVSSTFSAHCILRENWDLGLINFQEQFCVLFLNNRNEVLGFRCLHTGTINSAMVDLKLLFSLCCQTLSSKIIIAHNHPSGELRPSEADVLLTSKIKTACEIMDIELLDHIILSNISYASLAEQNLLN